MAKYNDYLITKEATKYWKKAIKNDRVMIANYGGNIYIVNGYNGFKFPANSYFWDNIARQAFLCDMPEDGAAAEYRNGERRPGIAADVARILESNIENITTAAERTPFTMDHKGMALRLFKNGHGDITTVNIIYDSMVDFSRANKIHCNGRISPVLVSDEFGFLALLLPVRRPDTMPRTVRETFAGLLEV